MFGAVLCGVRIDRHAAYGIENLGGVGGGAVIVRSMVMRTMSVLHLREIFFRIGHELRAAARATEEIRLTVMLGAMFRSQRIDTHAADRIDDLCAGRSGGMTPAMAVIRAVTSAAGMRAILIVLIVVVTRRHHRTCSAWLDTLTL
jgi:ribosomal protein S12 methylthiotransferase accessory factor YcaO